MDTGKLLLRQLRAAASFAETEEQRQQVDWWRAKVEGLRGEQPSAEPRRLEFHATPAGGATGTDGGAR